LLLTFIVIFLPGLNIKTAEIDYELEKFASILFIKATTIEIKQLIKMPMSPLSKIGDVKFTNASKLF